MGIEMRNRLIGDGRWIECPQRGPARFGQSRRLIFKKGLISRNFARLRGTIIAAESLQCLPALPTIFMVVPHADKRPAGASVLQIWIMKVVAVNGTIVSDRRRN